MSASSPSACRRAYADSAPADRRRADDLPALGGGGDLPGPGLTGAEQVLEIGTGSGYSAAILARSPREVISIERIEALAARRAERLASLGIENVEVVVGDGTLGAAERAPFEAIAVHATAPAPPATLLEQLAPAAGS